MPFSCSRSATNATTSRLPSPRSTSSGSLPNCTTTRCCLSPARCSTPAFRNLPPEMITLRNLQLRRGAKIVLDGVNVNVNPGEKVGLVGRNGAGKSSLFALLAGRLQADAGDFEIPARWRLGEVAQHMPETDQPGTDFVLGGDIPLMQAQKELADAEAA